MHLAEAKALLSAQNGMNLYRGCTHGCIYCDSRSLCYGMRHAFEDVEAKANAPALLEAALRRKKRRCMIATGAMSDPYWPGEAELLLTRRCLEIIEKHGFGLALQTKSAGLLRDIDLFASINQKAKCVVQMTLTTFDEGLCRQVEPNVSTTKERMEALCALRGRGIPTVVWLTPFLPYLNDTPENIRGILACCKEAGVKGVLYFGRRFGAAYICMSEREGGTDAPIQGRVRPPGPLAGQRGHLPMDACAGDARGADAALVELVDSVRNAQHFAVPFVYMSRMPWGR